MFHPRLWKVPFLVHTKRNRSRCCCSVGNPAGTNPAVAARRQDAARQSCGQPDFSHLPACGGLGADPEVPGRRAQAGAGALPGGGGARALHRFHRRDRRHRHQKVSRRGFRSGVSESASRLLRRRGWCLDVRGRGVSSFNTLLLFLVFTQQHADCCGSAARLTPLLFLKTSLLDCQMFSELFGSARTCSSGLAKEKTVKAAVKWGGTRAGTSQ